MTQPIQKNAIVMASFTQISETKKIRIVTIIKYACLFLFAYTAYSKVIDHTRFLNGLRNVHLISPISNVIAIMVPVIEIVVSILLIIPRTMKIGLIGFCITMIVFTLYIISAIIWEPELPCHCGGAIEKLTWMQHIWFNLAFIFLAILAIRLSKFSNY
jgi:hypothetical protein